MVQTLLSWPPGTPPSRLNLLQRQRYCGGVTRCVHTDIRCCCGGDEPDCGCANWPDDLCAPPSLPNLTFEIVSTTCPSINTSVPMVRCGYTSAVCTSYWKTDLFSICNGSVEGDATLCCERNTAYPSPGCFDYKLYFGMTVSGCETDPQSPQYPTSCFCGVYPSQEAWWRWDDIYSLIGGACVGLCYGCATPIEFDIYIHGFPPAPTLLSSSPATAISSPHRGTPVPDNLPEEVSNWLNGDNN